MRIPLTFGHTEKRSTNVNAGRCINMFPCVNSSDSKNQLTLSPTEGLELLCNLGSGEVRGLMRRGNTLYSVCDNRFYSIPIASYTPTEIDTIDTLVGKVWIEYNAADPFQIMICDGQDGYVFQSDVLTKITDADFPGCTSLSFIDNYGVITEPESGRLWNSTLNDFTEWEGTDFVTAEGNPDNIITHIADHREAWLFGEESVEVFKNSGDADAVFQRLEGTYQEVGTNAVASPAKKDNVIFWLDNGLKVRMAEGYRAQVISTPAISYQIQRLDRTTDAVGMAYIQDGHSYYVLTFPSGGLTIAYDIGESAKAGMPMWHVKSSGLRGGKWRGNTSLEHNGIVYIGDGGNGNLYKLNRDVYTENSDTIRREFTSQDVYDVDERRLLFHNELELEVEAGLGLKESTQGDDPEIMMQYSDNGGHTWSYEAWVKIGKIGEYANRARWTQLGSSRNRIYKFAFSDPVNLEAVAAYVKVSRGMD